VALFLSFASPIHQLDKGLVGRKRANGLSQNSWKAQHNKTSGQSACPECSFANACLPTLSSVFGTPDQTRRQFSSLCGSTRSASTKKMPKKDQIKLHHARRLSKSGASVDVNWRWWWKCDDSVGSDWHSYARMETKSLKSPNDEIEWDALSTEKSIARGFPPLQDQAWMVERVWVLREVYQAKTFLVLIGSHRKD